MNTIASNADIALPASAIQSDDKQAGATLIARAVDDVKKNASSEQDYLQQSQNEQDNNTENQPLEREQLEKVAQQLQDFMGEMNRSLQFQVDQDSGRDVIKVLDKDTGDIIKQYPSEEVLNLVSKLSETAGILIDQTV
ncbi:flagellar protein FlaG [Pseudoalteromonas nigrifaciens]|uniref:flagellar protein FlaG n=1 Tax=Pseudoalteromonas nigrifaciens TaxID=28109 RepID=UPI001787C109|nr:flagellar protein FlaG [Pseudoalteromonas nigrifaciens]MBE0419561.1 flagellar protein FlaG [Pseudoalteromonas nigrifaciens]